MIIQSLRIDTDAVYPIFLQNSQLLACNGIRSACLHRKFFACSKIKVFYNLSQQKIHLFCRKRCRRSSADINTDQRES